METLRLLFLVCLAVFGVSGVDRNNFKSCEQSGFCKRLRSFKPEKSQYVLNIDTVIVHGNVLSAEVQTVSVEDEKKTVLWKYALKMSALVDGTFRVEIDEADPIYPRYRTQLALQAEPKADGLKLLLVSEGKVTVANTQGHRAVINVDPLRIDFLDTHGDVAVSFNKRAQLVVEPLKVRGEGSEGDAENDVEGALSENFKGHHDAKPRGNEAISLDISFPDAENLYGIPEHTDRFHLKTTLSDEPYRLYNLDVFEYEIDSTMAIYGAVPVMYAHGTKRSAGIFWHNSAETWVDVDNRDDGTVVSSIVSLVTGGPEETDKYARFMSESGVIDVFVLLGPSPSDTYRQYTTLTGVAPLPPKFSIAYHQCRWNYVDEEDIRTLDENFDAHDIPADVYWLDIEYTDNKKYFLWDQLKFPHPTEMVANVTAKGRKMVIIVDPHIKREAGYFVHEDMTDLGYYVKNKDGKDYEGWCWPGSSSYPDFFNPAVSKYYSERYQFENFPGTSKDVHIWNDMNEPSVFNGPEITMPKDCRHYRPQQDGHDGLASYWEHRHVHNEYGLWNIRSTHEGMVARTDGVYRPFILTRSAFAGTQRFAAVWTGDNAAEWSHLAASVPMCLSLSAAGVSFCGADVGGFFKYPGAELMTRWYQAGAYQPFFRAHSHLDTKRREPWLYDSRTMGHIRDAVRRRYALIDHWYTLFYEHTQLGLPIMRAVFQHYPSEKETFTIDTQYLLGENLLIRPVVEEGVKSVSVYLPGKVSKTLWYDVDSYQAHQANGWMNQEVTIAKIPVYQRGGSIVPRKERVRRASSLMADDPYTFVVTLDASGSAHGTLYIDDGETYEYRNSKFIYADIEVTKEGITYSLKNDKANFATRAWVERIVVAGIQKPPKSAKLQHGGKNTPLQMTLHKGNNVLVVRKPGASVSEPWKIVFNY